MRWKLILCCAAVTSSVLAAESNSEWKPAQSPLMTRWAKDVSPAAAHPEYPRPQMVRMDWLNLNGLWDYAITPKGAGQPDHYQGKILVPFPIESALSGVMQRLGETDRLWYHRQFELPEGFKNKKILLHLEAVDWEATVNVNGHALETHRGGYDRFTVDISPALKADGPQDLVVSVWDPTEGGQPRGKQSRKPGGIFYTPSSGIWQTVWLEPVGEASISRLRLIPDIDAKQLRLVVQGRGTSQEETVEAVAATGGKEVGRASGKVGDELKVPVSPLELWSPSHPFLYDLKVELHRGTQVVDSVASYFGMREIEIGKDAQGIRRPMLNGHFLFQVGPLDQGFWPDGLYTAPTDEALRDDIEMTRKLGFNMTRKHVKVEPERWYYWCDREGLLVWQDMPSGANRDESERVQFEHELQRMVESHFNHPSIILWVVFNEGWGQYDTQRLTHRVKELDPTRLVDNASGWTDKAVGDVHDMHKYPGPGSPRPESERAAVLGEFGGLGLGVDGHTWTQRTWGYLGMSSQQALTRRYQTLLRNVYALKDDPGLSAAVYTQITDVETECNGLLTYDREVLKVDADRVAKANRGQLPPPAKAVTLVPTAQREPGLWRYSTAQPGSGWTHPEFDDSTWHTGESGFGTRGTPGAVVGTEWRTSDIWIRRSFVLPEKWGLPELRLHHDEDAEIYLNGVLAAKASGYTTDYEDYEIRPEALRSLKPGPNFLAIHCHQTGGGQFIDAGLVEYPSAASAE